MRTFATEIVERARRLAEKRQLDNLNARRQDHNYQEGKSNPGVREHFYGLLAELQVAKAMRLFPSDEELTTYGRTSSDLIRGLEIRARTHRGWDTDVPVWDKDKQKDLKILLAYRISSKDLSYEVRWLPFETAWALRSRIKMGETGRDMMGVPFLRFVDDDATLGEQLRVLIEAGLRASNRMR